MRLFIGFFGLNRSLRCTINELRANILGPIRAAGLESRILGHFHEPKGINNPRSGEIGIPLPPQDAGLLEWDRLVTEEQSDDLIAAPLAVARMWPDQFGDGYASARNLCFQLRSLSRLWRLIAPGLAPDDHVLFLRPDLRYLDPLDIENLLVGMARAGHDLAVPTWHGWGGLNDRFALANARAAAVYANRLDVHAAAIAFRGGLHGESLLDFAVWLEGLSVTGLPMRAVRVRANGAVAGQDLREFGLVGVPPSAPNRA